MAEDRVQRLKERASVLEYASRFSTLKGRGEKYGPCPMCGGSDRFHVFKDDQGWLCRKCKPEGGDIFNLICATQRCSFEEALDIVDGKGRMRAPTRRREAPQQREEHNDWMSETWQQQARKIVSDSIKALSSADDARAYLDGRKISLSTQLAFSVGYCKEKRGISLPWMAKDRRITAIKFRYVKAWTGKNGKLQRFCQLEGGSQQIFGTQLYNPSKPSVIIEGEFNAMSVHQVASELITVLSPGGDTNFTPMLHLLSKSGRKLLWLDDKERAEGVVRRCQEAGIDLSNTVIALSPNGKDANDILVEHGPRALRSFIQSKIAGGQK